MIKQIKLVEKALDNIDNDDMNIELLEKAMNQYCSNWDIIEGYKYAIMMTVCDQYENHGNEQNDEDLHELLKMLS